MSFWDLPYDSRRAPVLADNVVATSQPLAAAAGFAMLRQGGNAVDAALASAIALTIVDPTPHGMGTAAFAIVWSDGRLHGLNGSGRSPRAWTRERFAGLSAMPELGWDAVTVPGAPDAWRRLSERFGKLPFADLFEPALRYASEGFVVPPITAAQWRRAEARYAEFPDFCRAFLPGGRAPRPGDRFRNPEAGRTLSRISRSRADELYRGELAQQIVASSTRDGGVLSLKDLAAHRSEWIAPLSVSFRSHDVHELPPNGQGIAALIALGILDRLSMESVEPDDPEGTHVQIEAMKVGLAAAARHVADPEAMAVTTDTLLDSAVLDEQASSIDRRRAAPAGPVATGDRGTVYLTAADRNGMLVSFIQSSYVGFGSGVVVPGTGLSLQNRGHGFSLVAGHPNEVAGGKRPYHTIIPGFVTREGKPVMSFGVMGGHMQPQGHVQMCVRILAQTQNPQAASDAPRWQVLEDGSVAVEEGAEAPLGKALAAKGHRISAAPEWTYGGAQLVMRLENGYLAASDHRKDGVALGY